MKSDEAFEDAWVTSQPGMWVGIRWLCEHFGLIVHVVPQKFRPHVSQRAKYADSGDVFVQRDKGGKVHKVEIKHHPNLKFRTRSLAGWPYPDVIVCEPYTLERKGNGGDPEMFVNLSGDMRSALIVNVERTREAWKVERRFDRAAGEEKDFYIVPTNLCEYHDVDLIGAR